VTGSGTKGPAAKMPVLAVVREHRRVLLTQGTAVALVGVVRACRMAVIPLWGESIGLPSSTVALIFGLSSAIDMLLFYPAGKVMDRYGRVWVAVPCLVILGLGIIAVPFTTGVVSLSIVAGVMGFGNGMGSGIVMVLGADASPATGRASFLGVWRLIADLGTGGGPLLLGGITAAAGLATGVWVMGAVGLVGAAAMWAWVPRTLHGVPLPGRGG
jgi:MFS family permease